MSNRSNSLTDQANSDALTNTELADLKNVNATSVAIPWADIPASLVTSHVFAPSDITVTNPTTVTWTDTGAVGGGSVNLAVNVVEGTVPVYPPPATVDKSLEFDIAGRITLEIPSGTMTQPNGWTLVWSMYDLGYAGWDFGSRVLSMTTATENNDAAASTGTITINAVGAVPPLSPGELGSGLQFFNDGTPYNMPFVVDDFQAINTLVMRWDPVTGRMSTMDCRTGNISSVVYPLNVAFDPTLLTFGGKLTANFDCSVKMPSDILIWNSALSDSDLGNVRSAYCQRYESTFPQNAFPGDYLVYNGSDWAPKPFPTDVIVKMAWSFDIGFSFPPASGFAINASDFASATQMRVAKVDNAGTDQSDALLYQIDTNSKIVLRLVNDDASTYHTFTTGPSSPDGAVAYIFNITYVPGESYPIAPSYTPTAGSDWAFVAYSIGKTSAGGVQKTLGAGAPTPLNDSSTGVSTGDVWVDTVSKFYYGCTDDAVGASVWKILG